ncbi:MAG: aldehyde dehydrogenase family protein, partial [Ectothiorhodospiraceae bacterium]
MLESPLLRNTQGYINGQRLDADHGKTLTVTNPVDGADLARVPGMGPEETNRAVAAGRGALATPASLAQRRQWLDGIADALQANREEIGRILCLEHGKPWKEAQGEVDYAAGFFRYSAAHLDALEPRVLEERPRNCSWTVHYRPAGVVALVTPWNFPIGMIAKKLSAALAADCPSVIKPSSKTPLTMVALFHILDRELDLPPGKVNLVTGSAGPIGDTLCDHPDVRVLSFTGSTEVGRELIQRSAAQVKKLTLELGGNAPYIVFNDADLDAAADNLIGNKFRGGGQTCVCANRILVQEDVAADFAERVRQRASDLKVGDGMESDTDLGPLVDRNGYEKVRRHLSDALDKGAQLIMGEVPASLTRDWGGFFPPAIVLGVTSG